MNLLGDREFLPSMAKRDTNPPDLVEALLRHESEDPARIALTYYRGADGGRREDGEEDLTFGRLLRQARAIGTYLRERVPAEGPVLLSYPPGLDFVVGFLGCLCAGRIAVPAPAGASKNTRARLRSMVEDARPFLALGRECDLSLLDGIASEFGVPLQAVESIPGELSGEWKKPATEAAQIAYLQYTSGSTGSPRGVTITHSNLLHNLKAMNAASPHSRRDVALSWLPHFHDMGLVYGILEPLFSGFRCVLMNPATFLRRPASWLEALTKYSATHSGAPDFAYATCCSKVGTADRKNLDLSSWRVAFTGAEPVRQHTLENFAAAFKSCGFRADAFRPAYGLAEATLMVACRHDGSPKVRYAIPAEDSGGAPRVSCGTVALGMDLRVVDPATRLVCREGTIGEIWVSGPSVSPGYWRRPEETERVFGAVLDTSGFELPGRTRHAAAKYLRTGDLGFLDGGELFVAGRLKDVVIIRGQNHASEDIEDSIAGAHAAMAGMACAAFSVEAPADAPGSEGERLVVVQELGRSEVKLAHEVSAAIRDRVAKALSLQVALVAIARRGTIPRTSSGKIMRGACRDLYTSGQLRAVAIDELPENRNAGAHDAGSYSVARGIVARALRMHAADLDPTASLTALGLDSLSAADLSQQIEEHCGAHLPPADLLGGMTLLTLEGLLGETKPADERVRIPRAPGRSEYPLSFEQERLWALHQIDPDRVDNIAAGLRIRGGIDVAVLRRCLAELPARHEALRTSFSGLSSSPSQRVWPAADIPLDVNVSEAAAHRMDEVTAGERAGKFDLLSAPLVRARLIHVGAGEHVLVLVAHHLIADAQSLSILLSDLFRMYGAAVSGEANPLKPVPLQFGDFALWQRSVPGDTASEARSGFWRTHLAGAPERGPIEPSRTQPVASPASLRFSIPEALAEGLAARCREMEVTPFMWWMAVFHSAIFEQMGSEDIVVGVPYSGRARYEMDQTVGFFAYPLPLRSRMPVSRRFQDLLKTVRDATLAALANAETPYATIVQTARPSRADKRAPLFRVMLNQIRDLHPEISLPGLQFEPWLISPGIPDLDLALTLFESHGQYAAVMDYAAHLTDSDAALRFQHSLLRLLEHSLEDPEMILRGATAAAGVPAIAIAATFRADPLDKPLRFWLDRLRLTEHIRFAGYNQVWQQLLDPNGDLATNRAGLNVLLIRIEDWAGDGARANVEAPLSAKSVAEANAASFANLVNRAANRSAAPYLVCFCPPSPGYAESLEGAGGYREIEKHCAFQLNQTPGVYAVTAAELLELYPVGDVYDSYTDATAQMPYRPIFFTALATMVARRYWAISRPARKVIALDCDGTLWDGVCGEDGAAGLGIGPERIALQEFFLERAKAGVLLCLCSKNNREDVEQAFARPEMVLKREHFISERLNWESKVANLRSLASELNLAPVDFAMVDDDARECAEIRTLLPETLTVELPPGSHRIGPYLRHVWDFDILKSTAEDQCRVQSYRENHERELAQARYTDLDAFVASLNLEVGVVAADERHWERAAELTGRTTQFNVRPCRRNPAELRAMASAGYECLAVSAQDRFGNYGIVGVMVFDARAAVLEVDTFLLSCRALGRRIERQMLDRLLETARIRGLRRVEIPLETTLRNVPARAFLEGAGAENVVTMRGSAWYQFATPGREREGHRHQQREEQQRAEENRVDAGAY